MPAGIRVRGGAAAHTVSPSSAGVAGPGAGGTQSNQSSPKVSAGCWVRSEPLPQAMSLAGQYLSQPQQTRSGCDGWIGNFLLIEKQLAG